MDLELRYSDRAAISDHNPEEGGFADLNLLWQELMNRYLGSLRAFQGRISGPGISFCTRSRAARRCKRSGSPKSTCGDRGWRID